MIDKQDVMLAATTTAYSALLESIDHKETVEPDLTWLEVVIGNALVIFAAMLRIRLQAESGTVPTWQDYERAVQRAMLVGGGPVIAWQLWQTFRRQEVHIDYLQEQVYGEAMAEECRGSPEGHGECGS
jgi:hypothetical protein